MPDYNIVLPSKPKITHEEGTKGVYEIEGLYPGYGHTLGNSLRRIILSSLPGAAITSVKIDGVDHEFSTLTGVKEDVLNIILNLKKVRFNMTVDEPQVIKLDIKGDKEVKAKDLTLPGQVEVGNPDEHILTVTSKDTHFVMEATIEKGLGYMPKEALSKEKVDIGMIALDATFTPVRRVNYEVENMRVGDRTDFNRLRLAIETDGTVSPKEALEKAIEIMIKQLKAIVGFKEEEPEPAELAEEIKEELKGEAEAMVEQPDDDVLKTRIEDLSLSVRTMKALGNSGIRTIGGLVRKGEEDLLDVDGLGAKGITEIKRVLSNFGLTLKQ
ncbi:DNA-directed RNA polymerase subunit alpha [bacterium]|nr:DNA-directed RNA polymerase subunit alpha [bacterium]|tara:strand:+ start:10429 stop:11409 length:981 start_codon:yes stop_codon:yes gene_type:complete